MGFLAEKNVSTASSATLLHGKKLTPYSSGSEAARYAVAGDEIFLNGQQLTDFKAPALSALILNGQQAHMNTQELNLFQYPASLTSGQHWIARSITSNGRVVVLQPNTFDCSLVVEDMVLEERGWFELFGLYTDTPGTLSVTLRRCKFTRGVSNGQARQDGNIVLQGRPEYGQRVTLYLEDCELRSSIGSCFTGYLHPDSRVYLRGTTKLVPAAGAAVWNCTYVNTGAGAPADKHLVDERSAGQVLGIPTTGNSLALCEVSYDYVGINAYCAAGQFNTLPINTVSIDTANGWDMANNRFVVPAGQSGIYEVALKGRLSDNSPAFKGYGLGVDKAPQDSSRFMWLQSYSISDGGTRHGGCTGQILYRLNEGDQLVPFAYGNSDLFFVCINLIIKRIR